MISDNIYMRDKGILVYYVSNSSATHVLVHIYKYIRVLVHIYKYIYQDKSTMLHYAAEGGNGKMVEALLEAKADLAGCSASSCECVVAQRECLVSALGERESEHNVSVL